MKKLILLLAVVSLAGCDKIDLEGKQVADFICFNLRDYVDKLSPENTQLLNGTLFLTTGHHLFSTKASRRHYGQ